MPFALCRNIFRSVTISIVSTVSQNFRLKSFSASIIALQTKKNIISVEIHYFAYFARCLNRIITLAYYVIRNVQYHMVKSVQKISRAWAPLVKLTMSSGLEFDILFASIPNETKIQFDGRDIGAFGELIARVADRIKAERKRGSEVNKAHMEQMQKTIQLLAG